MKKRLRATATASAIAMLISVAMGTAGSAATDTTSPELSAPPFARFVVGQQIEDSDYPIVAERLSWRASDSGTGLASVSVYLTYTEDQGEHQDLVYRGLDSQTETLGYSRKETCSGFIALGWEVRATDGAGNSRSRFVQGTPQIVDQNGLSYFADEAQREFTVTRHGSWGTSHFTGWYRDTTWRTSEGGARVSYTRSYLRGQHFALVMATGPDRGKAAVYVDGALSATVDTYSATKQHRVLVYDQRMTKGQHTVRVVNLATAGRPRIDVDAVMYTSVETGC